MLGNKVRKIMIWSLLFYSKAGAQLIILSFQYSLKSEHGQRITASYLHINIDGSNWLSAKNQSILVNVWCIGEKKEYSLLEGSFAIKTGEPKVLSYWRQHRILILDREFAGRLTWIINEIKGQVNKHRRLVVEEEKRKTHTQKHEHHETLIPCKC